MSDPNAADWLSAWSTLGGAIATASAFWVAAIAFKQQTQDKHRAQASAVTVTLQHYLEKSTRMPMAAVDVVNHSPSPLYSVEAALVAKEKPPPSPYPFQYAVTLPPGDHLVLRHRIRGEVGAYADFTDSSGSKWKRNVGGDLEELAGPIPWRRRPASLAKALGLRKRSG